MQSFDCNRWTVWLLLDSAGCHHFYKVFPLSSFCILLRPLRSCACPFRARRGFSRPCDRYRRGAARRRIRRLFNEESARSCSLCLFLFFQVLHGCRGVVRMTSRIKRVPPTTLRRILRIPVAENDRDSLLFAQPRGEWKREAPPRRVAVLEGERQYSRA